MHCAVAGPVRACVLSEVEIWVAVTTLSQKNVTSKTAEFSEESSNPTLTRLSTQARAATELTFALGLLADTDASACVLHTPPA